jgi:PEP-CTERM motif
MRADKAVRPAGTPKMAAHAASIGKRLLKLRERPGESQIVALVDVQGRHDGQTLALVGVCVNRIGTGVSNANGLPLEVSVSAFDLGPVVPVLMPEPSTWAMMLLGGTGLGFAACRRTSRQLAIG